MFSRPNLSPGFCQLPVSDRLWKKLESASFSITERLSRTRKTFWAAFIPMPFPTSPFNHSFLYCARRRQHFWQPHSRNPRTLPVASRILAKLARTQSKTTSLFLSIGAIPLNATADSTEQLYFWSEQWDRRISSIGFVRNSYRFIYSANFST